MDKFEPNATVAIDQSPSLEAKIRIYKHKPRDGTYEYHFSVQYEKKKKEIVGIIAKLNYFREKNAILITEKLYGKSYFVDDISEEVLNQASEYREWYKAITRDATIDNILDD